MSTSLHAVSVPVFIAMLNNMKSWLDKAAATGREAELLEARLAPDMHPLPRQIQIASDAAKGAAARLAGAEPPVMEDTEASFAELKARCDKTIAFLQSVDAATYDAGAANEVVMTFPNGAGIKCDGETFVTQFALPNFYFHATTTYAILRAAGIEVGKQDFLAHMGKHMFMPTA